MQNVFSLILQVPIAFNSLNTVQTPKTKTNKQNKTIPPNAPNMVQASSDNKVSSWNPYHSLSLLALHKDLGQCQT